MGIETFFSSTNFLTEVDCNFLVIRGLKRVNIRPDHSTSNQLQLPRYMGIETILSSTRLFMYILQLPRYMGIETRPLPLGCRENHSIATSSLYGD